MKRSRNKRATHVLLLAVSVTLLPVLSLQRLQAQNNSGNAAHIDHVLLLSIDGLHAQDLARYITLHPHSALAHLTHVGLTYTQASTSKPSDSFPGLLAMVTGGSPRSTGVFYDDSYDRNLSAPGSNCATKGTEVVYDETIDSRP